MLVAVSLCNWLTCAPTQATEDKNNAIAQAEKTATKAKLADRLINGLSGENKRWNETIAKFGVAEGGILSSTFSS